MISTGLGGFWGKDGLLLLSPLPGGCFLGQNVRRRPGRAGEEVPLSPWSWLKLASHKWPLVEITFPETREQSSQARPES